MQMMMSFGGKVGTTGQNVRGWREYREERLSGCRAEHSGRRKKALCKHSYLKFGTQDGVSVKAAHVLKQKLLGDDL